MNSTASFLLSAAGAPAEVLDVEVCLLRFAGLSQLSQRLMRALRAKNQHTAGRAVRKRSHSLSEVLMK